MFWFVLVKYGIPEVREVSRNLPGARGFAVIEYGPMASHGDPIQAQNYRFAEFPKCTVMCSGLRNGLCGHKKSQISLMRNAHKRYLSKFSDMFHTYLEI